MASKAYVSLSARSMAPVKPSFTGSLSIRAPPTLDDSEFDVSSNGTSIDSGSESEGFVSGEESEMALARPFVVNQEADPIDNACEEEEGSVEVDDFAPPFELPAMHHTGLRVMPFAQLSSYDDEEEEEEVSEVEGDEMLSVVRVPTIGMPENFVSLPRINALDVQEEEPQTLMLMDSSTVNQFSIANELTFVNPMSSDSFIEAENGVASIRTDKRLVVGEQNQTQDGILEDRVEVEYSIATDTDIMSQYSQNSLNSEQFNKVKVASNELESEVEGDEMLSVVRVPTIDMRENFVSLPRINALDVEEEELQTLMLMDSSTVDQFSIANELTFVNPMSSDSFIEAENGVASIRTDKRLVVVEQNQTQDRILEDRVAQGEYSIATDTDIMSQYSQNSLNIEQFNKVKVASNELEKKEGLKLDGIDRLEGGTIKLIETGAVSMNSITQRKLEVDAKETTEMVEATSIMIDDSSWLKSNIEDHNKHKMVRRKNPQTQTDFSHTGELVSDAISKNIECTGRDPIFCLPTQEAAANGSQGFNLDGESEYEKLISITKSAISKVKLHDASANFESSDDACEGNNILSVESAKFSDPRLFQQTVCSMNVETGLDLGDTVKREAAVDLNTISQESKRAGSAPDGHVEGLISVGLEQFMEQISALSTLLGSKGSGKNSQQEQTDRNSHEKMNLLRDDAKEQLLCTANSGESDCNRITITSVDESSVISVKDLASFSYLPDLEGPAVFKHNVSDKEKEKVEKTQAVSVKFLRLVQRINLSLNDSFVLKVLYRLASDIERRSNQEFVIESAKILAKKLEENGKDDLDFSLNILVLGKSGVGKSAIINSIFGEMKVKTSAFEPATTSVKEVAGTIHGVKIRILDTPGLRSPMKEQAFNRKILSSIKSSMKKFHLDVILYVDRVDAQTRDLNDLPLLRSITSSLNPSIWQRTILTLTHAASTPWDGPSGCPLSYEAFVAQKSHLVQHLISQAVGDMRQANQSFMCPVSLVENHPVCGKNRYEECVLPNGLRWRSQLLVLCFSQKILCEVSSMAGPQTLFDHWKHFFFQDHSSSLGHPLSSLLQSQAHLKFCANWG